MTTQKELGLLKEEIIKGEKALRDAKEMCIFLKGYKHGLAVANLIDKDLNFAYSILLKYLI